MITCVRQRNGTSVTPLIVREIVEERYTTGEPPAPEDDDDENDEYDCI
jgi:hypothetical protein